MDLRIIVLLIAGLLVVISLVQPVAIRLGLVVRRVISRGRRRDGSDGESGGGPGAVRTRNRTFITAAFFASCEFAGPGFGPPGSPPQTLNPPAAPPPSTTFKQVVEYLPGYSAFGRVPLRFPATAAVSERADDRGAANRRGYGADSAAGGGRGAGRHFRDRLCPESDRRRIAGGLPDVGFDRGDHRPGSSDRHIPRRRRALPPEPVG